MPSRYKKIGLFFYSWDENLGNAATQEAVIHNIRIRCPEARIFGFCLKPQEVENNHGILCFPIRRGSKQSPAVKSKLNEQNRLKVKAKEKLKGQPVIYTLPSILFKITLKAPNLFLEKIKFLIESYKILRTFDLIIVSGGNLLTDLWGGTWSFPYTLLKWVILSKFCKVKFFLLNVGAGPIDRYLSKIFIKYSLLMSDYCSLRDLESKSLVENMGFVGKVDVYPDSVYSIDVGNYKLSPDSRKNRRIVGINPIPFGNPKFWPIKDSPIYQSYIQNLVLFGSWLIEKDYNIILFASSIGLDPPAIEDFMKGMKNSGIDLTNEQVVVNPISGVDGLLSMISRADFIVSTRLHPTIFSHLLNRPVLAIAYHGKVRSVMADFGHSEYCLDIESFDFISLKNKFQSLERNNAEVKATIFEKVSHRKKALEKQFDSLLY